jgi:hypothetical protein
MKASVSLLSLFLIVAGCTDATTDPTGLTPPSSISGKVAGNPPPPPIDAAVAVCVPGGCAVFEGTYMTNSEDVVPEGIVKAQAEAGVCTTAGHASLKIDEQLEPQLFDAETSANAQIKCSQLRATGGGMIEINGVEVQLDRVVAFNNSPECTTRCGEFIVHDENGNEIATGAAFNRDYYEEVCEETEGEGGFCNPPPPDGGS